MSGEREDNVNDLMRQDTNSNTAQSLTFQRLCTPARISVPAAFLLERWREARRAEAGVKKVHPARKGAEQRGAGQPSSPSKDAPESEAPATKEPAKELSKLPKLPKQFSKLHVEGAASDDEGTDSEDDEMDEATPSNMRRRTI